MLMLWPVVARSAEPTTTFYTGADISMLPEIEKKGGVFRADDKPGDALHILHESGCNLWRIRLFVNPDPDFSKNHGATQDLTYVRALAKRIKAIGGVFLLDLHYSDTWADPGKQFKPAAWKDLDFDALEKRVHDYTADVLKTLTDDGTRPNMVQVGNEIASGILWPDGQVWKSGGNADTAEQWTKFTRLLNAGCKAVREASTPDHPIRIMLHVHGGGKPGLAKWFFSEKLGSHPVDFDIVGLSFYPAWDDEFDALKQNLIDAIAATGKDVIVAETSYPWKEIPDIKTKPALHWPQTKAGQGIFLRELTAALRAAPQGHGVGFIYWYPEAIPLKGRPIWRQGGEALFDENGNALPALAEFRVDRP
jgi:arabinogalactan endo-1,4-beta-galactosidase